MNSKFLYQVVLNKRPNKGFTLIELLVVIIILGILASIALPTLLGTAGRARETEASNLVGAVNRGQQAFFSEQGGFFTSNITDQGELRQEIANNLSVTVNVLEYYDLTLGNEDGDEGKIIATNDNRAVDNTRDYAGATAYDTNIRQFSIVTCRQPDSAQESEITLNDVEGGSGSGVTASCGEDVEQVGGSDDN